MTNHQRNDAASNTVVGKEFENMVRQYWASQNIILQTDFPLSIGVSEIKKEHNFDLGSKEKKIIVECKSHRWTETGNC